jgi:membrane-bound metal-dependent hydrolase YbcI (DUF457 family)
MMKPTHRFVGTSTGLIAATAVGLPLELDATIAILAGASSSIPDDLEKLFRLPHRRLTHRPFVQLAVIGMICAAAVAAAAPLTWALAVASGVAVGCLAHSLADAMTVHPDGIQLLWPLSRRGYHVLPRFMRVWVGTRSRSEMAFLLVWSVIVLCYMYARYHQLIPQHDNRA